MNSVLNYFLSCCAETSVINIQIDSSLVISGTDVGDSAVSFVSPPPVKMSYQLGTWVNQRRTASWSTALFPRCVLNCDICLQFTSATLVALGWIGPRFPKLFLVCVFSSDLMATVVWKGWILSFEALMLCWGGATVGIRIQLVHGPEKYSMVI